MQVFFLNFFSFFYGFFYSPFLRPFFMAFSPGAFFRSLFPGPFSSRFISRFLPTLFSVSFFPVCFVPLFPVPVDRLIMGLCRISAWIVSQLQAQELFLLAGKLLLCDDVQIQEFLEFFHLLIGIQLCRIGLYRLLSGSFPRRDCIVMHCAESTVSLPSGPAASASFDFLSVLMMCFVSCTAVRSL